jgi:hypothetical protein
VVVAGERGDAAFLGEDGQGQGKVGTHLFEEVSVVAEVVSRKQLPKLSKQGSTWSTSCGRGALTGDPYMPMANK